MSGRGSLLRLLLTAVAIAALPAAGARAERPPGDRPNILLIIADDLGYVDIGIHGGKDVPTPNIDA